MAVSCEPQSLMSTANCMSCLTPGQRDMVKVYLLALIAGVDPNPQSLMSAANCMACLSAGESEAVQTYLLCVIANK